MRLAVLRRRAWAASWAGLQFYVRVDFVIAHALTRIPFRRPSRHADAGTLTLRFPTFAWFTRPRSCIDGGYHVLLRARATAVQASGAGGSWLMCQTYSI